LYLERLASFEAVGMAGKLPLLLDPALNKLTDTAVPRAPRKPHTSEPNPSEPNPSEPNPSKPNPSKPEGEKPENRHSNRRSLRAQVDALVDGADLFIGIYGRTAGNPDYTIGWLTWIEYELLRFLTRLLYFGSKSTQNGMWHKLGHGGSKPSPPSQLDELNKLMRDREHISSIRRALLDPSKETGRPYAARLGAVMRNHCMFFLKRDHGDEMRLSYDLQEFLLPLRTELREVRTTVHCAARPGDYHFFPAHAGLFEDLYNRLRMSQKTPRGPSAQQSVLRITIRRESTADNKPAVLYPLLRELFQHGLNVQQLFIQCPSRPGAKPAPGIVCIATPIHSAYSASTLESVAADLKRAILNEFAVGQLKVDVFPTPKSRLKRYSPRELLTEMSYAYSLQVLDVPGILWSIVTLLASYGGNITHMHFDERAVIQGGSNGEFDSHGRQVRLEVVFEIDEQGASGVVPLQGESHNDFKHAQRTFEHQLKLLHGVISIAPLAGAAGS
jgi:hypothetical protein